jgi:hypothetical protein
MIAVFSISLVNPHFFNEITVQPKLEGEGLGGRMLREDNTTFFTGRIKKYYRRGSANTEGKLLVSNHIKRGAVLMVLAHAATAILAFLA